MNGVSVSDQLIDRGRESGLAPPPSEPDVRISRIRLSGWWFTSRRTDARAGTVEREHPCPLAINISIRVLRTEVRRTPAQWQGVRHSRLLSPDPSGHSHRFDSFARFSSNPPSCAPFAPSQLRDFIATMGALTPVHSGSLGLASMNSGSFSEQVSLIHASRLLNHSVSNHPMPLCRRFITLPLSSTAFRFRSRLRLWLAGSSMASGRIEFVILRTGHSPPVALHHASLRRSYIRLQAGERMPEEDFHLSDYSRFQAH